MLVDDVVSPEPGAPPAQVPRAWFERTGPLDRLIEVVLAIALVGEFLVVTANVIARTFFSHSFNWSYEVAGLALSIMAFLGGAYAYRRGEHLSFQLFVTRLAGRHSVSVRSMVHLIVAATCAVAAVLSTQFALSKTHQVTPTLGLNLAWTIVPQIVGFSLMALYALQASLANQKGRRVTSILVMLGLVALALILLNVYAHTLPRDTWAPIVELAVFVIMILIGTPIGFVLIVASAVYLTMSDASTMQALPITLLDGSKGFVLLAIPFFIWAGFLLSDGGLSQRIFNFARLLVGRLPGGLLHVVVVSDYLFSGLSGSKVADVSAVGAAMKSTAEEEEIPKGELAAVLAAAGAAGEAVPPSVGMLILGGVTAVSVEQMFVAGFIPAAVIALCLMGMIAVRAIVARRRGGGEQRQVERPKVTARMFGLALLATVPAMIMPIILVGGILSGTTTATEVATLAIIYAWVVAFFLYRQLSWRASWRVICDVVSLTGMTLLIVSAASAFSFTLIISNVLSDVAEKVGEISSGRPWVLMLLTIPILMITGALFEGVGSLLIFGPALLVIAQQSGVDTIQFSLVVLIASAIGAMSPPIGIGFFVSCNVTGARVEDATRRYWWYWLALIFGLVLVAFVPWFTTVGLRLL